MILLLSERLLERAIFKAGGILFQDIRAISALGNAGWRYDNEYNVPLSQKDREFGRSHPAGQERYPTMPARAPPSVNAQRSFTMGKPTAFKRR